MNTASPEEVGQATSAERRESGSGHRQVLEATGDPEGVEGLGAAGAAKPGPGRETEVGPRGRSPRSGLPASAPSLSKPRNKRGTRHWGVSPAAGENARRPLHQPGALHAPCPAAVSDPRSRTPSPGGFPRVRFRDPSRSTSFPTGSRTAAAEDQTSQEAHGHAPFRTRHSTRLQRPRLRGGSAAAGIQLAGEKRGDIYEEGTRNDLRRSSQGGGREFLERGVKSSVEKDQGRI